MTPLDATIREAREAIVNEHMATENRHDFAATLATFGHPRYEVIPSGDVHDGKEAVTAFYDETHRAFPDFQLEMLEMYHSDKAVIAEVLFKGTQTGPWRGLPATGKAVAYQMCAVYQFEGTVLVCERLYFDILTVLRQVGIARDPTSLGGRVAALFNHPVTVGLAVLRSLRKK